MTQIPEETAYGYEAPAVTQLSVFFENNVGKMLELTAALASGPTRMVAFSVLDAADHAVVRVVTSNADAARRAFHERKLAFAETQVTVVALDEPTSFERLCRCLVSAEVSIRYAYPALVRIGGASLLVMQTDDPVLSAQIFLKKGFALMGEADFRSGEEGGGGEYRLPDRN